jgi:release factor glutamine methyltransferase
MPQLNDIYEWIKTYTRVKNIRIALSETNIIISSITGIPREHLLIHKDIVLSNSYVRKIKKAIKKRSTHYPLQYIIGSVEFMGIDFLITPGVLIPRPETELLVETALKYIAELKYKTILDLCCGSGIVGLSIASIDKNTFVSLSDSSVRAINLTSKNSGRLGLTGKIKLYKGDLFSKIPLSSKFDLIVSNPPYVPHTRIRHLQKEVLYEPVKAIDGGEKGLEVITRIIQQAGKFLNENGMLMMEHDDTHKKYLEKAYTNEAQTALQCMRTINDLSGLPRISIFSMKPN